MNSQEFFKAIIPTQTLFELSKAKPISINRFGEIYNDTYIMARRKKIEKSEISNNELCWLAYARYLDTFVFPDEVAVDCGENYKLGEFTNLFFGEDCIIQNGQFIKEV